MFHQWSDACLAAVVLSLVYSINNGGSLVEESSFQFIAMTLMLYMRAIVYQSIYAAINSSSSDLFCPSVLTSKESH